MRTMWKRTRQVALLVLLSLMFIEAPIMMNGNPVQSVSQNSSMTSARTVRKNENGFAVAEDEAYTEDFASTTHMDAADTNTTGWGTGNLTLPHANPFIAGSYATPDVARGIYVSGDYAYVAANASGLEIVNITDPTHPSVAGSCVTTYAKGVYVSGDYAYVADDTSGLQVVNVTDPTHPSIVATCATGNAEGVYVSGDYAYVADWASGLVVVSITVPTQPSVVGSYATLSGAMGIYVSGHYAFVVYLTHGLQVFDITNPTNPSLVGSSLASAITYGVYVSGHYAYVADLAYGLRVFNITDPKSPSLAGSCATPGYVYGVCVSGDYAYVAESAHGLLVVNITDPTHPSLAGNCTTPDVALGVYVSGNYAYVADFHSGLQVVKIADAVSPSLAGADTVGRVQLAYRVYVSGDYAYVLTNDGYMMVVNITDPTHPFTDSSSLYFSGNLPYDVYVSGDYAFVAADGGLHSVNITDPAHPSELSHCLDGYGFQGVYVSGDCAYAVGDGSIFFVVNITDPTDIHEEGFTNPFGGVSNPPLAWSVYVSGDYAYVGDNSSLQVVNITDPKNPSLAGSCATSSYPEGVYVSGDFAYVADDTGLQVVNITNPAHPFVAASYTTPSYAIKVYVSGDFAYVADDTGLQIVNITDPTHPSLAGSYDTSGGAEGVYVSGDYAYVADVSSGLKVIEVQRNLCREYASSATAQSLAVNQGYSLINATLQVTETQPSDTSTAYYLSADNGSDWESVKPGVEHTFVNSGRQLCWRAVLSTNAWNETPLLSSLSIDYTVRLNATSLTSPSNGLVVGTHTPLLQWTDSYSGVRYLVQVDSVATFNSGDLHNITVPVGQKYCTTPALADGVWYWRVAVNDTGSVLSPFSSTWSMTIDTTGPTWDQTPTNRVVEFLTPFRYDLNASDSSGISTWWINDTARFAIDSSGVITNTTPLAVGTYGIQVWVNDTLNNVQTAKFSVTVQDTIAPTWDQMPTDRVVEFLTPFRYDLNASDPSGISKWWFNDTAHFAIDSSGVITNATSLAVGVYGIQVWVNDTSNNVLTAEFSVTVQDTTSPYWLVEPANITLDYGEALTYQLQAADSSGISSYVINDTVHFSVDAAGHVTNATTLEPGTYGVLVTVADPYGNSLIGEFSVTVRAQQTTTTTTTTTTTASTSTGGTATSSTPTTSTSAPPDFGTLMLILGGLGGIVLVVIIVVYTKRRPSP